MRRIWIVLLLLAMLVPHVTLAQSVGQSATEAKEKAREAIEAFTKAMQQMSVEAGKRAEDTLEAIRGTVQDSVKRACDAAQNACLKACDGTKCEQACKTGRSKCQAE